tara:strand:- start:1601 stop:1951 length:351 start_codon:yes stop_codon:yes gene_type:complete
MKYKLFYLDIIEYKPTIDFISTAKLDGKHLSLLAPFLNQIKNSIVEIVKYGNKNPDGNFKEYFKKNYIEVELLNKSNLINKIIMLNNTSYLDLQNIEQFFNLIEKNPINNKKEKEK